MTEAWVTLATSDGYAVGALVLANSLKMVNTTKKLHCMVTSGVSHQLRDELSSTFDAITFVNVLDSGDTVNLRLIERPDLGVTFTKIHCWRLTQYTKCVFLDADCLVVQNCDELFEHEELSAVADIGWPDCFNSGVFVFQPSEQAYSDILNFAIEHGSFDGGDQGLLNAFFQGWRDKPPAFRLPFIYNMTSGAIYTYAAAFKKYGAQVKIVHFLGAVKPWQQSSGGVHYSEHLSQWWSIFRNRLEPKFASSHVSSSRSSPMLPSQHSAPDFTVTTATTITTTATTNTTTATAATTTTTTTTTISSISLNQDHPVTSSTEAGDHRDVSEEPSVIVQRHTPGIVNPPGFPLPPAGPSPEHSCMRVFRCVPPLYEVWTPLRHLPTHLAQQMATFSLGPHGRIPADACSEIPGVPLPSCATTPPTDEERMRAWEVGHPDYMGQDSYENIQKAIDHALK